MIKPKHIKGWLTYLALIVAAFAVHACAVDFDQQATPSASRSTAARPTPAYSAVPATPSSMHSIAALALQ